MKTKDMLKPIWYLLCRYVFVVLSDEQFSRLLFYLSCKRFDAKPYHLNLEKPRTFNEFVNFFKLYSRPYAGTQVADKVAAREYVAQKLGSKYLINKIDIFSDVESISFDKLPNRFALKASHGSGWNIICTDKRQLNWEKEKKKLKLWLKTNLYYIGREWQYKDIPPRLLCEELLEYEIKDYKIFCVNGKPRAIQVDTNRFSNHKRDLFDLNWQHLGMLITYPNAPEPLEKPKCFLELLQLAESLSVELPFCRIDLYEYGGKIFFGEITLHPGGGYEPFGSKKEDLEFASLLGMEEIDLSLIKN